MADLLPKTYIKICYNLLFTNFHLLSTRKYKGTIKIQMLEGRGSEEGRKRVELAECVRSGDEQDELDKYATPFPDR